MKRLINLLLLIVLSVSSAHASTVPKTSAEKVAVNWMAEKTNSYYAITETFTIYNGSSEVFYIYNLNPTGFVIVSADDIARPVVGYSYEGCYSDSIHIPAFDEMLESYGNEIVAARKANITPLQETKQAWETLSLAVNTLSKANPVTLAINDYLLKTEWDQKVPYNLKCPVNTDKNCSTLTNVVTGCVATAMAQIMKYHNHPSTGRSNHSYTHATYRALSADFGNTTYDWDNMLNTYSEYDPNIPDITDLTDPQILSIATLMKHCGVSVDMDYGCSSGALGKDARNALVNYFRYSIQAALLGKDMGCFTDKQWNDLMKDEIDNSRPVFYGGVNPTPNNGGHAFVVDGYQEEHFHLNWGWGGSNNTYFLLNDLTPGSHNYNSKQAAIVNIIPVDDANGLDDSRPVLFACQRKWEAPKDGGDSSPIGVLNSNYFSSTDYSGIAYNVSSDAPSWLTVAPQSGVTPNYFVATASLNSTGSTRTGHIIIIATTSNVYPSSVTIPVTQQSSGKGPVDVALVIDRSGSMDDYLNGSITKLGGAQNAASTFVGLMNTGDNIAVVSFDDVANVNFPLTTISSDATKVSAQNAIDALYAGGSTSIGGGIQEGQGQLDNGSTGNHQAMVVLSDGLENSEPYVADVLPNIPSTTDIYTIALGSDADQNLLSQIATQTGGTYYYSNTTDLLQIYNIIRGTISNQQTYATYQGTLSQGSTQSHKAGIDAATDNVMFSLSFQDGDLDMGLVTPSGTVINSSTFSTLSGVTYSKGGTYIFYNIENPESGDWTLNIQGTSIPIAEGYTVSVQGTSTLELNTFLGEANPEQNQPITIYASLAIDSSPVTDASIQVFVDRPTFSLSVYKQVNKSYFNSKTEYNQNHISQKNATISTISDSLILYDDGLHGDGAENDGLYANQYYNTLFDGSYTFTVIARGSNPTVGSFRREYSFSTVVSSSTRPLVPTLISPPNGEKQTTNAVTLQWSRPDTTLYTEIKVSTMLSSTQSTTSLDVIDTLVSADTLRINNLEYGKTYYWRIRSAITDGSIEMSDWSPEWSFTTPQNTQNEIIYCYPNPFNPMNENITITFRVEDIRNISITIYDVSGVVVKHILENQQYSNGVWKTTWDGRNEHGSMVANGTYFYIVESNMGEKNIGKIAVLK